MKSSKLKAVNFVQDPTTKKYQVVGIYRNIHHSRIDRENEIDEMVFDEGSDYYELRGIFLKTAKANNVDSIDLVTTPFPEMMVRIQKEN